MTMHRPVGSVAAAHSGRERNLFAAAVRRIRLALARRFRPLPKARPRAKVPSTVGIRVSVVVFVG